MRFLCENLQSLLLPYQSDVAKITLQNCWKVKKQIILFYRQGSLRQIPRWASCFLWPDQCMSDPWADADNLKLLIPFLNRELNHRQIKNRFFVSQAIVTPHLCRDILLHPISTLYKFTAAAMQGLHDWLNSVAKQTKLLSKLNIVIVDFVDPEFASKIINMNKIY